MEQKLLWNLKVVCRWSLGLVWIWEGLVPKMILTTEAQRRLVERSGLYWPDPDGWLVMLGGGMIVAGAVLCTGWRERGAVLTASLAMTVLIFLVVGNNPASLGDLHGGIAKDACLYAVAWVVWKLAPIVPSRPADPGSPARSQPDRLPPDAESGVIEGQRGRASRDAASRKRQRLPGAQPRLRRLRPKAHQVALASDEQSPADRYRGRDGALAESVFREKLEPVVNADDKNDTVLPRRVKFSIRDRRGRIILRARPGQSSGPMRLSGQWIQTIDLP